MPAAGHEVKIIERVTRKRLRLAANSILRIRIKDHDVRHFQRRRRTDAHTRRKARGDRALRCTDGRDGIWRVIIRLKIKRADDATAHSAARQRTLHKYKAVRHGAKHAAFQISVHRLLNGARRRRFVTLAEVKLRDKNDMNRPVAPLRQAPDAVLVDTSHLDFDQSVQAVLSVIEERIGLKRK